jgi:hypothetical protein
MEAERIAYCQSMDMIIDGMTTTLNMESMAAEDDVDDKVVNFLYLIDPAANGMT